MADAQGYDVCRDTLDPLVHDLEVFASITETGYDHDANLWGTGDDRLAELFVDDLDNLGIVQALSWIEFHVLEGAARRDRLSRLLHAPYKRVRLLEGAHVTDDPFRYLTVTAADDAQAATTGFREAAAYVREMIAAIQSGSLLDGNKPPGQQRVETPVVLSDREQEALDFIRNNGPVDGNEIARQLGVEPLTVYRHVMPKLKEKCGVQNKRSRGYFLPGD